MTATVFIAISALMSPLQRDGEQARQPELVAIQAARQDNRLRHIFDQHERLELDAHFNEEFQVWIVELVSGEQDLGTASVKNGQVVEVDLRQRIQAATTSPVEMIEESPRVRDLRERFPELSIVVGGPVKGERQSFELVLDGRELGAGFVNVESGEVQFRDEMSDSEQEVVSSVAVSFRGALWEICQFPVGGRALFWFSTTVTLLVVFPFRRLFSIQSLDVLVLVGLFPLSLIVWQHTFQTYAALFVLSGYLLVRCVWRSFQSAVSAQSPNLQAATLLGMLAIVLAGHVQAISSRGPDDAGIWTVFGGQYVWEHGRFPYGQIGEGGTYGPLLYGVAGPLVHVFPPTAATDKPGERVVVDMYNVEDVGYQNCDFLPAKILALLLDIVVMLALVMIGRQANSWTVGLSLALVYAANGLTIQRDLLFVSHLAPTACVVLAIAARRMPVVSGVLLAIGAGVLFWPAFLIPTWLAYYASRGRDVLIRCGSAITVVGFATIAMVYFYTEPIQEQGPLLVFAENTWGHQEAGGPYSRSEFGFWGQWIMRNPDREAAITGIKQIVRWSFGALCILLPASLYFSHGKRFPNWALLGTSAALALGLQFWKTHGGGLYTGWYLSLVVATLLMPGRAERKEQP